MNPTRLARFLDLLFARSSSRRGIALGSLLFVSSLVGCGSHAAFTPPPIVLNVSVSNPTVTVPTSGSPVLVPITVVAPTETVTFSINGLPGGLTATYKESESNPSGLLTLIASTSTQVGTYMPQITVGSSGHTASTSFTLLVQAASH
jgi:hypothetical protein